MSRSVLFLMLLCCVCFSGSASAQKWTSDANTPASSGVFAFKASSMLPPASADVSLLREVNGWNGAAVRVWMYGADRTAYPVMFGSVPAWWIAAAASEEVEPRNALLFSVAWIGTAGAVWAGKRLLARPRPYTVLDGLVDRGGRGALDDRSSLPSGHAALSAVSATWLILEQPEGPTPWVAGAWAVSVGLSRVWKGVHYPSDVLAGFVLGAGAGVLVHQFR